MRRRSLIVLGVVAAVGGAVALERSLRATAPTPADQVTTTCPSATNYSYGATTAPASESPRAKLEASVRQWPEDSGDRMKAMMGRLTRVSEAVNTAAGGHCIVMLGQTGHGAASTGDGIITVDTTSLWRLSEDALAALLAHEIAHDVLGHVEQLKRLSEKPDEPGHDQRVKAIEEAADELAARTIAATKYRPEGFAEMLSQTESSAVEPSSLQQWYPREQRARVFREAYSRAQGSTARASASASRPAPVR